MNILNSFSKIKSWLRITKPTKTSFNHSNNSCVTRRNFRTRTKVIFIIKYKLKKKKKINRKLIYLFRYNDELGFNYLSFLKDIDATPITTPLYKTMLEELKQLNSEPPQKAPSSDDEDIVLIIAKIKAKVIRERVTVIIKTEIVVDIPSSSVSYRIILDIYILFFVRNI